MYDKRIKIFVILIAALLLVCLLRLTQMQLLPDSQLQDKIAELKRRRGLSRELKTVRGKILDRNGKVLAVDEARFELHINYRLASFMDARVREGKLLKAGKKADAIAAVAEVQKELDAGLADLKQIISKCAQFRGAEASEIETEIQKINNFVWNQRVFQVWRHNFPNSEVFEKYNDIISVPLYEAIADFEKKQPSPVKRLRLVNKVDIAEMHKTWPLLRLRTDDDIFTAQLEFLDIDGVQILAKAKRFYPFGPAAAQTIGWVGPATQEQDKKLFANDKLSRYLGDEVCGREDGVEYVCEAALRGRRGEVVYDIDHELVVETQAQFGKDVSLTLDVELQKRIENYLADYDHDANCGPGMAAVVIDVATGDILALVSMPVFDLSYIRQNYKAVLDDPNEPLRNRAINQQYPPGSVVKPLILIAGLESGEITPDEIIRCPAQKAPEGWPSCWWYNRYPWMGHDDEWQNNTHNAIKGSCNIYFSRLADRIDSLVLQQWLFEFGYGHKSLLVTPPLGVRRQASPAVRHPVESGLRSNSSLGPLGTGHASRNFRQAQGQISNNRPGRTISRFEQLPPLERSERRYFGIGQGNLRVTPLQVANSMAAIARGGLYKTARLFMDEDNSESSHDSQATSHEIDLNISPQTLDVVRDGMSAVVNEPGGTAYKEFAHSGLAEQGIEVYGKTGSTEQPDDAWFAGFAEDNTGRSVAIAVLVEGGQHGSSDAAPLARDIIQFCIEAGYIGNW